MDGFDDGMSYNKSKLISFYQLFMMKIIIEKTCQIPSSIKEQIQTHSPREWLKKDLCNKESLDPRVNFVNSNISWYILLDDKLITYAAIGQDKLFNESLAKAMEIDQENTVTLLYLFTIPKYQKQWYAKKLIDSLAKYAEKHFTDSTHLIRTTDSETNKNLYLTYGAELIAPKKPNSFLQEQHIDNQYFFSYILSK